MTKSRFKVPHTLVLLFGMVVLAQILSYILPAGAFERVENAAGRLQVVPGSFHLTPEVEALKPWAMFTAIPEGFSAAHEIIFFVFIIGGAFAVLRATGAVDAALGALLRRLGDRPFWLVAGGVLVFALGSSTIGMAEEYLPFVPVLIALCLALGYDAVTAVGIASLFGFTRASKVLDDPKVKASIPGRLLVFFPGEHEDNNYRLLDARDGWNYMAVAITADDGADA